MLTAHSLHIAPKRIAHCSLVVHCLALHCPKYFAHCSLAVHCSLATAGCPLLEVSVCTACFTEQCHSGQSELLVEQAMTLLWNLAMVTHAHCSHCAFCAPFHQSYSSIGPHSSHSYITPILTITISSFNRLYLVAILLSSVCCRS